MVQNGRAFGGFSEIANFLWSVADLLRGAYRQADKNADIAARFLNDADFVRADRVPREEGPRRAHRLEGARNRGRVRQEKALKIVAEVS